MVFDERRAIQFRIEKIAEEKERMHQQDKALNEAYTFYINRLRELDQSHAVEMNLQSNENAEKTYSGDLERYDFDALKQGLNKAKKKNPVEEEHNILSEAPTRQGQKNKQYNLKEVAMVVEEILLDHKAPMPIHHLRRILQEKGYNWKHFLPTLANIMRHSQHLKKPSRGMIAYISESSDHNHVHDVIMKDNNHFTTGQREVASAKDTSKQGLESGEMGAEEVKAAAEEIPNSVFEK